MPELSPFPTVVVVGLGNIGSHTIEALGRFPSLKRVIHIDPDVYSTSNLPGQRIGSRDVGQPKALVQSRRLRVINPALEVIPFVEEIANVPVGWLRGSVVVGCVDSIRSRIALNESVWRAGAIWIDGGVEPGASLSRVSLFAPGVDAPCFECGLDSEDYDQLETRHLCGATPETSAPINSFNLGSLTAALMMMELEHSLNRGTEHSLAGRQLVLDARSHVQFLTRLSRQRACRFHHQTAPIQRLDGVTEGNSVREGLVAAQRLIDSGREASLGLSGHAFARAWHCPCGCAVTRSFVVASRLSAERRRCAECGRERFATGIDQLERLTASALPAKTLGRSLRSLGLRAGDVLTISDGEHELAVEIPRVDGTLVGSLPEVHS